MALAVRDGKFVKYNDIAARGFAGQLLYGPDWPWRQGVFVEFGDQPVGRLLYGVWGGRLVTMDMENPENLRYGLGI